MKKGLSIILALALVMGLSPPTRATGSDFYIQNGVLIQYRGVGGDVTIPEGVTSIYNRAFDGCVDLTGVTIPEGVTAIGEYAFEGCTRLTGVTIPASVTSIGSYAFAQCASLTDVTIPEGVTTIGGYAFADTPWLNAQLEEQGEFIVVNGILLAYHGAGGDVVIPEGVTTVGECAFAFYTGLTSVTIPSGVTAIGDGAFAWCDSLTGVTIPNSVTSIGNYAFLDCSSLTGVVIPEGVTSIGKYAFAFCDSLVGVTIPSSVTTIGDSAFAFCTDLTGVTIPPGITSIGCDAFADTPWLEGQGEFAVVNGVLLAYQGAGGDVAIPSDVTAIGERAFGFCTGLTNVTIPEGVTTVGEGAFRDCANLTSATIPEGVTTIGDSAFFNCTNLTSAAIPSSVTSIGADAFSSCHSLTGVTIPEGVTAIGEHAFSFCTGLTSVTIPEGVTAIGEYAFNFCDSLTDVYYAGSQVQWEAISIGSYNDDLTDATIHYAAVAYARPQTVSIDGKAVELQAYALKDASGNATNYVKLRDVAYVLNGSAAQFNVGWDGNVNIVTGSAYNPNGSEMSTPFSGDRAYTVPTTATNINGVAAGLAAIVLTDDNGGGHTYYQLRDLGKALGFNVGWSAQRGIFIETDKPYTDAD